MAQSDPEFAKLSGTKQAEKLASIVSMEKSIGGANDTTLRTAALKATDSYFAAGGPGFAQYNALKKTNPTAAQQLWDDHFSHVLSTAKSQAGAAAGSGVLQYDPTTGTLK